MGCNLALTPWTLPPHSHTQQHLTSSNISWLIVCICVSCTAPLHTRSSPPRWCFGAQGARQNAGGRCSQNGQGIRGQTSQAQVALAAWPQDKSYSPLHPCPRDPTHHDEIRQYFQLGGQTCAEQKPCLCYRCMDGI